MDARERSNGVINPLSLRPGVISAHSQRDALRVEDRDPQFRHAHSVVNLIRECAKQALRVVMAVDSRDILNETALTRMPEQPHLSLQFREAPGPQLAEAGDRVRQAVLHSREGDRGLRDPSSWFSPECLH